MRPITNSVCTMGPGLTLTNWGIFRGFAVGRGYCRLVVMPGLQGGNQAGDQGNQAGAAAVTRCLVCHAACTRCTHNNKMKE